MYNPEKEEVEWIKSDRKKSSSTAIDTQSTVKTEPQAKPYIRWKDKLLEGDLYITQDAGKTSYELHIFCPRCLNMLRITSDRKDFYWDGKCISISPFECTWELNADENAGSQYNFGATLCKWKVGVEKGIARDA